MIFLSYWHYDYVWSFGLAAKCLRTKCVVPGKYYCNPTGLYYREGSKAQWPRAPRLGVQATDFEHSSASLTRDMYLNIFFFIYKRVLLPKVTLRIKWVSTGKVFTTVPGIENTLSKHVIIIINYHKLPWWFSYSTNFLNDLSYSLWFMYFSKHCQILYGAQYSINKTK